MKVLQSILHLIGAALLLYLSWSVFLFIIALAMTFPNIDF